MKGWRVICLLGLFFGFTKGFAGIHTAPIIIRGAQIASAANLAIDQYRLFRSSDDGKAIAIPFQIDEIDRFGDYILPLGNQNNGKASNRIFDMQDELSFMGDDVGPVKEPRIWDGGRPPLVYEIKLSFAGDAPNGVREGAVYLAAYIATPPPLAPQRYVNFDMTAGEVTTSRYRYFFDPHNYLVTRGVEIFSQNANPSNVLNTASGSSKRPTERIVDSSTMYLKADLKYFLTVEANQNTIESTLDAYKVGPIRTIVRVSFYYRVLRVNFELGMYTEISFFSNSVLLPAVLYNPLDGNKSLNAGSGFYYGFNLADNPSRYKIDTNMPPYKQASLFDFLRSNKNNESLYWIAASRPEKLIYVEISPSQQMRNSGSAPMLYVENLPGEMVRKRADESPKALGESPVNMGLYFDLTKLAEGEHLVNFRLFFENKNETNLLKTFRTLSNWRIQTTPKF